MAICRVFSERVLVTLSEKTPAKEGEEKPPEGGSNHRSLGDDIEGCESRVCNTCQQNNTIDISVEVCVEEQET